MRNCIPSLATIAVALCGTTAHADDLVKQTFETCVACHSVKAGENGVGPQLNNLIGRTAGTSESFHYSRPMKRSAIVWDEKNLSPFLRNPPGSGAGESDAGAADEATLKAPVQYI
jgi:cytochrome c